MSNFKFQISNFKCRINNWKLSCQARSRSAGDIRNWIFDIPDRGQTGFTLLELILVISMIAIVSVVGIVAFLNYSRTQALNTGTADVVTMLNTAKSRALSQVIGKSDDSDPDKLQTRCGDNASFTGYRVLICKFIDDHDNVVIGSLDCISSKDYELQLLCSDNSKYNIDSRDLPVKIIFPSGVNTPISFLFRVLTGAVEMPIPEEQLSAEVNIKGYGNTKTIEIFKKDGRIVSN